MPIKERQKYLVRVLKQFAELSEAGDLKLLKIIFKNNRTTAFADTTHGPIAFGYVEEFDMKELDD